MTKLLTLEDLGLDRLHGERVFVRVDFNVPLTPEGEVLDATRLEEALPTLRELSRAGARLLLASHCGRPKGAPDPRYSLRPVARKLAEMLGAPVRFAADCVGAPAEEAAAALAPGGVALLENLRFHGGETANDGAFSAALAALARIYVDDAFGSAHRAHASVVGMVAGMERKAAGRLMAKEVAALGRLLGEPVRPFAALLGGAKIEGKIDTLENLLPRLDLLLLGGGMANTFLAAAGYELGDSLYEPDRVELARDILARASGRSSDQSRASGRCSDQSRASGRSEHIRASRRSDQSRAAAPELRETKVLLPTDLVVTDDLKQPRRIETVAAAAGVPAGLRAVDIGPATRAAFAAALQSAGTLFWNGPLGVFEQPPFDAGTLALARALARCPGYSVIGGGETVAAAHQAGVAASIGHVSTGGGAALELLAGRELPGVAVLEKRP
jgi:phosphoglycerate kinase